MHARHPQLAELGLFLLVVASPLLFTPFSTSPFGDPKLVVLAGGALALWASGLAIDRRLAVMAGLWVTASALAAVLGVDPIRSLAVRTEGGGGLVLVVCCAALVTAGAGIDDDLRERARRWVVVSAAIVGGIGILVRLAPELLQDRIGQGTLTFVGSTMGNQIFAAAFMSAGIAAALAPERRSRNQVLVVAFLALGAATFGERSSLILPVVAMIVTLWRAHAGWRQTAVLAATVVIVLIAWQIVEPLLPARPSRVGAALAPLQGQATDTDRQVVWRTSLEASAERPVVGWGLGATQVAYMTHATPAEIEEASRSWVDAHNLFLETVVTSGLLGLIPLIVLFGTLLVRAVRSGPRRAWVVGAAAALGAYSLVEPLNLVLTPLLFLFAGMAAGPRALPDPAGEEDPRRTHGVARVGVSVLLAASLLVSLSMITGATFERWGRKYGEEWALRAALRAQPWRLSATEYLALDLAGKGRAGDVDAGREATRLIGDAVERFPWDVNVRLWAADVDTLLGRPEAAAAWRDRQIARFPADAGLLTGGSQDGSEQPVLEPPEA